MSNAGIIEWQFSYRSLAAMVFKECFKNTNILHNCGVLLILWIVNIKNNILKPDVITYISVVADRAERTSN